MVEILPVRSHNLSSLRRGVLIVGFLIAVVIISAAIVVSMKLRQQTIDNASRQLSAVSRLTAERTTQTFSAADLLIRSIQDSIVKPSLPDEATLLTRTQTKTFYDELVNLQKLLPQLEVAAVADANGKIIADTREFPAPVININGNGVFGILKGDPDRGLAFAHIQLGTLNHQWLLYLARALKDDQGRFVGMAEVGIPLPYFENYLSTIDVGPETSITLVGSDLSLIARWPRIESAIGKILPVSIPSESVVSGDTSIAFLIGADNRLRLVSSTRFEVNKISFFLSVTQTRTALLAPWRTALTWIGLFSTTSLIVLCTMMLFVLRAIQDEESWSEAVLEREIRLSTQAVELIAARDLAESANRVRGQFLANMSHELRTPLNAVLGFSEILEKELFGPLGDPRYKEFVLDIHSSGKHLLDIISNVLDLAKVDAGKLELNEESLNIVDLMKNCVRLVADTAKTADVKLAIYTPEDAVMIFGDALRLKQILLNLLSNAVKFTPSGHEVSLSAEVTDAGFVLRVTDTGIGMTQEEAVQAMQAFRQIDNSFSRRYQGTGLGLPLAKSLVDLHEGTLTVDSVQGRGTTVTVLLPPYRIIQSDSFET